MEATSTPELGAAACEAAQTNGFQQDSDAQLNRLVFCLAARLLARIPRGMGIELADLVQAGNVGLIQAVRTWRSGEGTPLAGYAKFRIRGEMLDAVRRHSGRSRTRARWFGLRDPFDGLHEDSLANRIAAPAEDSPLGLLTIAQRTALLSEAISRLPARQRTVVRLRYLKGCSLRQIGEHLSVNESRACQIHRAALGRLRRALSTRGVTGLSHLI